MIHGHPVVDADSHKCENPVVFADYIEQPFRDRFWVVRDRYGEPRFAVRDRDPNTGATDFERVFLQAEGYGKGTYCPFHDESSLGGLFNRVRLQHMDREGIDHQVVYGSVTLAFASIVDPELAVALCRAYNDYITDDCAAWSHRLHPVGVLPLQDPSAAVEELQRCVEHLGMPAVSIAPHVPIPHPDAPEAFPRVRVPKPLSHPDFRELLAEAERRDVAIGIHGAPGAQLAGGTSDQLDTFTLVHVFANRSMQQAALAQMIFGGVFERFPRLRVGLLEAGAGWLPDLMHSLHEHWEKRIVELDPYLQLRASEYLLEFARERRDGGLDLLRKARQLAGAILIPRAQDAASREELEAFWYEHPELVHDPWELLERGQIFLTVEPDDPAALWVAQALGDAGRRLCCMAVDYGHWDATLRDCVKLVAERPGIEAEHAVQLLSTNALDFYGERLRRRIQGRVETMPLAEGAIA